ncbi:adenosine deaminase [Saccharata proteae CBS 121410]|uniref:Adenine deaminase n=1 Tax=Saccharata proteae CBS 121410 TaxID=1314787 RepID=A0A9P4HLX6_9PEZI|nr:adenosine deaminase [Saccharata proteae CBS 121410]
MCNSTAHAFLKALPKCEHHMHLEGALTPALLFSLAASNSISLPRDDPAFASPAALLERYSRFTSLDDFLHYYFIAMSALVHADDYEALAMDYFEHAAADGVAHAEVFFDPQAHTSRGVAYDTVLAGFSRARDRALKELGITSELICCFLRHLPAADCLSTFEHEQVMASYLGGAIKGIGLDSSEADFPPHLFEELYFRAGALGLRRTAHAGEEGPAAFISDSLDKLGCERIDHGRRVTEDPALVQRVARDRILLTTCPLSNVVLRGIDHVAQMPYRALLDAGVRFSINSDDPAYFGGYILDNYCAVHEAFGFSIREWDWIVRGAIEGSWCGDERKAEMLRALDAVMTEFEGKSLV